jgi:hypothetical protein
MVLVKKQEPRMILYTRDLKKSVRNMLGAMLSKHNGKTWEENSKAMREDIVLGELSIKDLSHIL